MVINIRIVYVRFVRDFSIKSTVWVLLSDYEYSLVNILLIRAKKLYTRVSALICVSVNL